MQTYDAEGEGIARGLVLAALIIGDAIAAQGNNHWDPKASLKKCQIIRRRWLEEEETECQQ
jgi:hypothetical protein